MKKLFLFLSCLICMFAQAQEGLLSIVHNNQVDIAAPPGTGTNGSSLNILNLQNNTRVVVTNSTPTSSGTGVGVTDIDIMFINGNSNVFRHFTYGIQGAVLTPKDVIEDQINGVNFIVITGQITLNNVTKGFIMRMDQTATPTTVFKQFSITGYYDVMFHQILRLNNPNSLKNGDVQYAVLATAKTNNFEVNTGTKDIVLLINQPSLIINTIQLLDLGQFIGSMGFHQNKMGYKLLAESDNARNSLYIAGSYIDITNTSNVRYGIHISRFDYVSGNLVYNTNTLLNSSNSGNQSGWIHPSHLFFDPAVRNGRTGTLYLSGGNDAGNYVSQLSVTYLSINPALGVNPDWIHEVPTSNIPNNLINGVFNTKINVNNNNEMFISSSNSDLVCVNLNNNGSVSYFKSVTPALRANVAFPIGDFTYDMVNNLGYGITTRHGNDNLQYTAMTLNNTDGCCFAVYTQTHADITYEGSTGLYPIALQGSDVVLGLGLLSNNPGVETQVQCNFCNGQPPVINGPTEVWCQPVTFTIAGCGHFSNYRWNLTGPNGINGVGKITSHTRNSVTIDFSRPISNGNSFPGTYTLTYQEVSAEPNCSPILASFTVVYRNLTCSTGTITGNNSIICKGNSTYSFAGCPNFPSGTVYEWSLTTLTGNTEASINGANNGTSVNVDFNSATTNNTYGLTLTARFGGCVYTSAVYQITHSLPAFSGVVSGITSIDCDNFLFNYTLSNPDNVAISSYEWTISPSGLYLTNATTNTVTVNFSTATQTSYTLTCTIKIGDCFVKRQIVITKQDCCPINNTATNEYQSSYNTLDISQQSQAYIGKTISMYTSAANSNMVLQEITSSTNSAFSISEIGTQGQPAGNKLYYSANSQDQFQATAFTESLIAGRKVVIGNKDNKLYVAEIDANGNVVSGRQRTFYINGTTSSNILEATSIVRTNYLGNGLGYCILINVKGTTNRVYLLGITVAWSSYWVNELSFNQSSSVGIHAHKLVEYTDFSGNSNYIVLGVASTSSIVRGFVMDTKVSAMGSIGVPSIKLSNNVYFSGRDIPGIGLVFGGSNNPTDFTASTCATFLTTDYNLNTIAQKILPNYQFEALDVRVSTTGNPVFLMFSRSDEDNTGPFLYHLLELDQNLNVIPGKGLYTVLKYQNTLNNHDPHKASKNLMDNSLEGGYAFTGQEESGYDFMVCKTGANLQGRCITTISLPLSASSNDAPKDAYANIANATMGTFALTNSNLDLIRICCDRREGIAVFDKCKLFHAKQFNIRFIPTGDGFCMDEVIQFEALGDFDPADVDYYEWNFGDGTTYNSTSSNLANHTFPITPGSNSATYTVNLTIHFKNGCTKHYVNVITVDYCDPCEKLNIHPDFAYSKCDRIANFFPTPNVTGATYEWDFGDGSAHSFVKNSTHTYAGTGLSSYTVCLKITFEKCTATICKTIHVGFEEKDTIIYHCPLDGNECLWLMPGTFYPSDYFISHLVGGATPDYNSSLDPNDPIYLMYCPGYDYEFTYYDSYGCPLKKLKVHIEEKYPDATLCKKRIVYCTELPPDPESVMPDCPNCIPVDVDPAKIIIGPLTSFLDENGSVIYNRQIKNLRDCRVCEFYFEIIDSACAFTPSVDITQSKIGGVYGDYHFVNTTQSTGAGTVRCGQPTWTITDLTTGAIVPNTGDPGTIHYEEGHIYRLCLTITYCACGRECTKTKCWDLYPSQERQAFIDNKPKTGGYKEGNNRIPVALVKEEIAIIKDVELTVKPNPTSSKFVISSNANVETYSKVGIYNATGQLIEEQSNVAASREYNLSGYASGVYTVKVIIDGEIKVMKVVLQ